MNADLGVDQRNLIERLLYLQSTKTFRVLATTGISVDELRERIRALEVELSSEGSLKQDQDNIILKHYEITLALTGRNQSDVMTVSRSSKGNQQISLDPVDVDSVVPIVKRSATENIHVTTTIASSSSRSIENLTTAGIYLQSLESVSRHISPQGPGSARTETVITPPPVRRSNRASVSSADSGKISLSRSDSEDSLQTTRVAVPSDEAVSGKIFVRKRSMYRKLPSSMLQEVAKVSSQSLSPSTIAVNSQRQSSQFKPHRLSVDHSTYSRSTSPSSSSIDSKDDASVFDDSVQLTSIPPVEFGIIEADFSVLIDNYSSSITSNFSPTLSWSYPKKRSQLSVEGILSFCFPSGVNINFLHYVRAQQLISPSTDERHILQFNETNDQVRYACCLIAYMAVPSPSLEVTRILTEVVRNTAAANKLKLKICQYLSRKRKERWNCSMLSDSVSTVSSAPSSQPKSASRGFLKWLRGSKAAAESTMSSTPGPPIDTARNSPSRQNSIRGSVLSDHSVHGESSSLTSFANHIVTGVHERMSRSSSLSSPSYPANDTSTHRKMTAEDALKYDQKPDLLSSLSERLISNTGDRTDELQKTLTLFHQLKDEQIKQHYENEVLMNHYDHVIVSRRAYCIITNEPLHPKVFKVLQAIADAERKSSIESTFVRNDSLQGSARNDSQPLSDSLKIPKSLEKKRKTFLEKISTHIVAHDEQRDIPQPILKRPRSKRRSDASDTTNDEAKKDKISVPGYADIELHQQPNHYPLLKEWTAAVMLTYLSPTIIIKLLNLLLVEKSVIIFGKQGRPGVVTAVTLAVKALIAPFPWEGAFVPLVPDDVRELFEAPVPFIAGTIRAPRMPDALSNAAVLVLDEMPLTTPMASESGNSTSRNVEYLAWFSYLPDINTEMPLSDDLLTEIAQLRERLLKSMDAAVKKAHGRPTSSRMRSLSSTSRSATKDTALITTPDIYFTSQMSSEERRIVSSFLSVIHKNNFSVCGDVTTPAAWKKYIKVNYITGELSFQPHLFIEPMRSRMEWIEAVANTQHFMSYVETQQVEYLAEEHRLRAFLRDWLFFRLIRRKRMRSAATCM